MKKKSGSSNLDCSSQHCTDKTMSSEKDEKVRVEILELARSKLLSLKVKSLENEVRRTGSSGKNCAAGEGVWREPGASGTVSEGHERQG